MQRTIPSTILFVNGAFQKTHLVCPEALALKADITSVSRCGDLSKGIESQADALLSSILAMEKPVAVIGHSLGALVAYRAHQLAPKGTIVRTALINCGSIGEPMPTSMDFFFNPLKAFGIVMDMMYHPESPQAIYEATGGIVRIGKRTSDLVMLAGTNDRLIPSNISQRVAQRIGARLIFIKGGHNLLQDDSTGELLNVIVNWFRTGKGLRKLRSVQLDNELETA